MKSNRIKIILVAVLLGSAAVIWGFNRFYGAPSGLNAVSGGQKEQAEEFARELLQDAGSGKRKEFLARCRYPRDPGLRESYMFLAQTVPARNPEWSVKRADGDEMYYVHFLSEANRKILILLTEDGGNWKFVYAMQE